MEPLPCPALPLFLLLQTKRARPSEILPKKQSWQLIGKSLDQIQKVI